MRADGHSKEHTVISVIICSIDHAKFTRVTKNYTELLQGEAFEIIGIHDARSLCEGYNRGIKQSSGSILIFSHDDIEILSRDFVTKLKNYMSQYDVIGVAGTTCLIDGTWTAALYPHLHGQVAHWNLATNEYAVSVYGVRSRAIENIQALDGLFFAAKRTVTDKIRFDDVLFDGFHFYDLDFTFSAYLSGYKLAVCNDIVIAHASEGPGGPEWAKYRMLFLNKFRAQLIRNRQTASRIRLVRSSDEVLAFCQSIIGTDYFGIW